MNNNLIVISSYKDRYVLVHIVNDKAVHIYAYNNLAEDLMIGSIVNGRIEKKLDNINACFVRIDANNKGYINKPIKCETVLPVMYKKEPVADKKALYTDELSLTGEYVVVFANNSYVRCSSKISSHKSKELKEQFAELSKKYNLGILLRTKAAENVDDAYNEASLLLEKMRYIIDSADHRPEGSVLYKPLPQLIIDCEQLLNSEVSEIVTDVDEVIDLLSIDYESYFGRNPLSNRVTVRKYCDDLLSLAKLYAFESKLSEALSRIVHLRNGSFITIDRTEALYAIDVNSSSFSMRRTDKEESLLRINIDAAKEIIRQIIIRNITGVIIVDFLKMNETKSYELLEDLIKELIKEDNVKCEFYGFTRLGLAEFARQKKRGSLFETMR